MRLIGELEPEATVDFSTNTSAALTDSLVTDELDLALVWGSVNEPSIGNLHVCSFPMAWLGSPKHFECATPLDVIDLARMPIIMHREDSSGYLLIKDYFTTHGVGNSSCLAAAYFAQLFLFDRDSNASRSSRNGVSWHYRRFL